MKSKEGNKDEEKAPEVRKTDLYCKCTPPKKCKYYDIKVKTKDELQPRYNCSKCKAKPMYTAAGTYYCLDCRFFECLNCAGHYKVDDDPKCLICGEQLEIHDQNEIKETIQKKYTCQECREYPKDLIETTEKISNYHICKVKNCTHRTTICQACRDKEKNEQGKKSKCEEEGHEVGLSEFTPAFANIRDYYKCDICDEPNFSAKIKRYACINCIYNICRRCKPLPKFGKLEISKEEKSSNIKKSKIIENSNQATSSDKAESHEIKNEDAKKEQKSQIKEIKSERKIIQYEQMSYNEECYVYREKEEAKKKKEEENKKAEEEKKNREEEKILNEAKSANVVKPEEPNSEEEKKEVKIEKYEHQWIWVTRQIDKRDGKRNIKIIVGAKGEKTEVYNCEICGLANLECRAGRMECMHCKVNVCWYCMEKNEQKKRVKKLLCCMRNHQLIEEIEVSVDEIFDKYRCHKCKKNPGNYFGIFKPKTEECTECKDYSLVTIPESIKESVYRCSLCYAYPVSAKNVAYQCLDCQFHLCNTCKIPGSVAEIEICPTGHQLIYSKERQGQDAKYNCSQCQRKDLKCSNGMHVCAGSEYIVCPTCKIPDIQKAFNKPSSIIKCLVDPSHHLALHKILKPKKNEVVKQVNFETCFQCGEENDLSEAVWGCGICNSYFICQKCVILSEFLTEENPKCPNKDGDRLYQTFTNYGFEQRFICSVCHIPNDCSKGRRACQKCNFSICSQCLQLPDFQQCSICLNYSLRPQKMKCIHDFKICKECSNLYPEYCVCPMCPKEPKPLKV